MNQELSPCLLVQKRRRQGIKSSLDPKVKDESAAKVLWWLLMSLRFVIPAYMLYVAYLYWTVPIAPYLQGPR
jgi:hypothetical protein